VANRLRTAFKAWVTNTNASNPKPKEKISANFPTVRDPFSQLMFGGACLQKVLDEFGLQITTVLDIGSGEGLHAEILRNHGKEVTEIDFGTSVYFRKQTQGRNIVFGNYTSLKMHDQFDLVWACHVLEHQKDVNRFLSKIHEDLKDGGILAITVPPLKHEIVGGHLSLWNGGLLMYNLVLAGFDCRDAKILQYGYNISLILRKRRANLPELAYDKGDIERLLEYFPPGTTEPFNGDIRELNWLI